MKPKLLKKRIFFLIIFVFTGFCNVFAQEPTVEPKPDKSTTDALALILNSTTKPSDRGSIQEIIKTSFLEWSQKSEFEKKADYKLRMQKQSQSKFTEICIEAIKKKINSFRSSDLSMNLLTYDAENEVFPAVFKFKGKEWKNQVKISIDKAQNFKENEWRDFQWQKEESSWCFINNDIIPSKIYLESNSFDITFKQPIPNQEVITVAFNDLGIENPYLNNFIFNYSTAAEEEKNIYSPDGVPRVRYNNYKIGTGLDGDGSYLLGGRRALSKARFAQECNESGIVVVKIEVDRNGKVISATPGVRGTTNHSKCLLEPAKRAALATKFNPDENAPPVQTGKVTYNFKLSN